MALGLQKTLSDNDFLPAFKLNAVSGDAVIAGSTRNADGLSWDKFTKELSFPLKFVFDFSTLEIGWIRITATGPDLDLVKVGSLLPKRPSKDHKQGFRVTIYNKEHGLLAFMATAKAISDVMDVLHDSFVRDEKANEGKLPVVEIKGTKKIQTKTKEGMKTCKQPDWSIVSWVARPDAMIAKVEVPVSQDTSSDDDF